MHKFVDSEMGKIIPGFWAEYNFSGPAKNFWSAGCPIYLPKTSDSLKAFKCSKENDAT